MHDLVIMAYTYDLKAAEQFREEVQEAFPGFDIYMDPLSLVFICNYSNMYKRSQQNIFLFANISTSPIFHHSILCI